MSQFCALDCIVYIHLDGNIDLEHWRFLQAQSTMSVALRGVSDDVQILGVKLDQYSNFKKKNK